MKQDGYRPWNWGMNKKFKPNPYGRQYQGMHQFKDHEGTRHGSFQVFWSDVVQGREGWYWLSDKFNNDVVGPFESSYMAYHDAIEQEQ
jgi:hypothetical protein